MRKRKLFGVIAGPIIVLAAASAASAASSPPDIRETGRGVCIGTSIVTVKTAQAGQNKVEVQIGRNWETVKTFSVGAGSNSTKVDIINLLGNVPKGTTIRVTGPGGSDSCTI